ncbi:MAG: transcriptional regulator [Proteobacteria bacterium]|jgi:DNA-binding transcriptional ArsR family regulator|nr:transcriptional regulator [Pseudomonadota bacterium]
MSMSATTKAALDAAKAKRGPTPAALLERQKETTRLHRRILEALAEERTVPELAEATGIDAAELMFHVNALRKYGKVEDAGKRGDYLTYRRK